jgi:hypothetical protein
MQSQNIDVCKSEELLEVCYEFLKKKYEENGLQRANSSATELDYDLQAEPEFQSVNRVRQVKRHFVYEAHDKPVTTPEKKFETEFFNTLLDTALMSKKDSRNCVNTQKLGLSCTRSANYRKQSLQNTVQTLSWLLPLVRIQISKEHLCVMN